MRLNRVVLATAPGVGVAFCDGVVFDDGVVFGVGVVFDDGVPFCVLSFALHPVNALQTITAVTNIAKTFGDKPFMPIVSKNSSNPIATKMIVYQVRRYVGSFPVQSNT